MAALMPVTQWLPCYQREWLRPDLIAGITLAAYVIPVSMAYASLAGLPPQAGLYCYLLAGGAYALFGTSRQLAVGPTSAISILVGATLGTMAVGDPTRYWLLGGLTALLVSILSITAYVLRLGQVVSFISETVLTGFKAGVALTIASTQLPKLFGITGGGEGFFGRIQHVIQHLGETNLPSLAIGTGGILLLVLGEKLLPKRPTILIVVALSIGLMSITPLAERGVKILGQVPGGFPAFGLSGFRLADLDQLLPLALACFLLSYIESSSTARSFALEHRYPVNTDQELLAIGAANLAAALGQGYPVAGGMSQSAVNDKGGARTPMALVFTSIVIGLVLSFLTGLFSNLPEPVLAAILLVAVKGLINVPEMLHLRRVSRPEFRVAMVALAGVLFLGVLQGVLLAAIVSLLLLIRRAAHPHTALLGRIPGTSQFGDVERHPGAETLPGVLIYRVYGALLYFNAERVRSQLISLVSSQQPAVTLVILDLSSSPLVDLAGARMLGSIHEQLATQGVGLKLAEARGVVRDLLRAERVMDRLGVADPVQSIAAIVASLQQPAPLAVE